LNLSLTLRETQLRAGGANVLEVYLKSYGDFFKKLHNRVKANKD
jgi:hypothetical protein